MTLHSAETIQERPLSMIRIVGSTTKWQLTTEAEFQSFLHKELTTTSGVLTKGSGCPHTSSLRAAPCLLHKN